MKHIAILIDKSYPNLTAIGVCMTNVISIMKDNYNLSVIAFKGNDCHENITCIENINFFNMDNYSSEIRTKLIKNVYSSKGLLKRKFKILLLIDRIKGYVNTVFGNSFSKSDIKAYYDRLISINEDNKIDCIISCVFPIETLIASVEASRKCNGIPVISIVFDPFANNNSLHRNKLNKSIKFKKNLALESKYYGFCDKIISMPHMKKDLLEFHPELRNKIIEMEHPTLIMKDSKFSSYENPRFLYAGSFNKGIRTPEKLIEIWINKKMDNMKLYLITNGNYNDYINKNTENFVNVDFLSAIKKNELDVFIEENIDILISVGNLVSNQSPSKIFEYIGFCKPIIHFYYLDDDPVIDVLKCYPLKLLLDGRSTNITNLIKQINEFVLFSKNYTIDSKEIENQYYYATPKYFANKLCEEIKGLKDL